MRRQSIKALIGMFLVSVLLGLGVLVYSYLSPDFEYTLESNIESNQDYYPDLTADLARAEEDRSE